MASKTTGEVLFPNLTFDLSDEKTPEKASEKVLFPNLTFDITEAVFPGEEERESFESLCGRLRVPLEDIHGAEGKNENNDVEELALDISGWSEEEKQTFDDYSETVWEHSPCTLSMFFMEHEGWAKLSRDQKLTAIELVGLELEQKERECEERNAADDGMKYDTDTNGEEEEVTYDGLEEDMKP